MADQIDLIFDEPEKVAEYEGLSVSSRMCEFKNRMYSIIHGGYNLLCDSRANNQGTEIDGQVVRTAPVREGGEIIGYRPTCPSKKV